MKILVIGRTGQVAQSLKATQPSALDITYLDRHQCNLLDVHGIQNALDSQGADLVINAAAYTAVDLAEDEPDTVHAINAQAPAIIASWVRQQNARLIHLSTDFVFDGTATEPYQPEQPTNPIGEYGASKLAGERAILDAAPDRAMIIRTAWVYSESGHNFVRTMLKLMAERDEISIVNDQTGSPTSARSIARMIWSLVEKDRFNNGIFHWTDNGVMTWHEFGLAIQQEALETGLLERRIPVHAITTSEYPTPARRPSYSVLDTTALEKLISATAEDWRSNLREVLTLLASS